MRVIILNQFFYPDHSAASQYMTDLAESLVEHGVEVTALSGRGRYNGGDRLPPREVYKGVRIERAWATSFGKGNLIKRLSDYLTFYLCATWKLLRLPRHDIVMALTTPPFIGLVALVIGRLRGMRVVALVQDVYPDVAVSLGALNRRNPATRLLDWLNRYTLRSSDKVIVVGECMRERVVAKVGEQLALRVRVIYNWADAREIRPLNGEGNSFAEQLEVGDKFVLLFSGNLGHINEFPTVLDAALILRDRSDILFLFIGEGVKKASVEKFAERHKLSNIRLLPYQPRETLRYSLAAADAALVTLAEGLAGLSVPSKTYASLAAGLPVLFVGDARSSIARIVAENNCGEVVAAGDHLRLARVLCDWASNKGKVAALGRAARATFERDFERSRAVSAYMETFAECMGDETSPEKNGTGVSDCKETSG
ncbi:MAG TPA: glycosyltransferase family 4 protein [Pyrinomonadaceae bacterium]|nr:glycosyltransferase family 4 protein [Pyrinomonadaceae bacterium]